MNWTDQYDCLLGGAKELPLKLIFTDYTAARYKEANAMYEELSTKTGGGRLVFQQLPKHMRRRVMSHNAKRLPIRLREKHMNQLKKSGLPAKRKEKPRKTRRHPKLLNLEHIKSQTKPRWLETHIWHAKRFKMVERWGYKLPQRPYNKSFRACFRAAAHHCLLQDISYVKCIEITGSQTLIVNKLNTLCDVNTGFNFMAKAFIDGNREGSLTLFKPGFAARRAIGKVSFVWKPVSTDFNRRLWLWVHAAYFEEVLNILLELFDEFLIKDKLNEEENDDVDNYVTIKDLSLDLCRFSLTGPLSHPILQKALIPIEYGHEDLPDSIKTYCCVHGFSMLHQVNYWKASKDIYSPANLPEHIVLSLFVNDPRYHFPKCRMKIFNEDSCGNLGCMHYALKDIRFAPIWDENMRYLSLKNQQSNARICHMRSKLLVPGTTLDIPTTPVPLQLIQKGGNIADKLGKYGRVHFIRVCL